MLWLHAVVVAKHCCLPRDAVYPQTQCSSVPNVSADNQIHGSSIIYAVHWAGEQEGRRFKKMQRKSNAHVLTTGKPNKLCLWPRAQRKATEHHS